MKMFPLGRTLGHLVRANVRRMVAHRGGKGRQILLVQTKTPPTPSRRAPPPMETPHKGT